MKKVKISKTLAKQIHKELIETHLGDLLEKELPELKKQKLEFNRWIKDDNFPLWLAFFGSDGIRYGFDSLGEWYVKDSGELNPNFNERNRYALNNECYIKFQVYILEKYNDGDLLKCVETGKYFNFKSSFYFDFSQEKSIIKLLDTNFVIFKDGVFAEKQQSVYPPSLQDAINKFGIDKIRELIK
jgi:hypothetical protein